MKVRRIFKIFCLAIFVALAFIAMACVLRSKHFSHQDSDAIEFIKRILVGGGTIYYENDRFENTEFELSLDLVSQKAIEQISRIQIRGLDIFTDDFDKISPLKKIKGIGFINCKIYGLSLKNIEPELKRMEGGIGFQNCFIENKARLYLPTSIKIDVIGFTESQVDDSFLQCTSGLEIDSIIIRKTPISEKGLVRCPQETGQV